MLYRQVIFEVEKNLSEKLPRAVPIFHQLVKRCLRIVEDPEEDEVKALIGKAHPKDLAILTSAKLEGCHYLVTFNIRDYQPGIKDVKTMTPGDFLTMMRRMLAGLTD